LTTATFLGTGNFLVPGRYWNGFVLDRQVLVEPSPTVLPHLRRCGLSAADLDVVVISHFHPDHTFGWPFLLLEVVRLRSGDRPFCVVGPPGVEAFLAEMMGLGAVSNIVADAHRRLDMRYIEVDGSWQDAGPLRFRAIEVEHVPDLRCYGYVLQWDGRRVGYSGDVRPCRGLDELAGACDTLILECNGPHPLPVTHMDVESVTALRQKFPGVPFVLTHLGEDVDAGGIPDVTVPDDFDRVTL
jgi:ribonuclease BN (tRNA processing enzyme)